MSRSGFAATFNKKTFGVTVMTDVTCAKMQRAKELLSSTRLTVGEIAEQCGYGCTYSFFTPVQEELRQHTLGLPQAGACTGAYGNFCIRRL